MCSTKADMPNLLEHMQTVEGRATTGPRLSEMSDDLLQVKAGGSNGVH